MSRAAWVRGFRFIKNYLHVFDFRHKKSSWHAMRSDNTCVRFSCALFSKGFYRLKKDRQSLSFQLEQQVSGRECERGESGRHTLAAKGQTFPWA